MLLQVDSWRLRERLAASDPKITTDPLWLCSVRSWLSALVFKRFRYCFCSPSTVSAHLVGRTVYRTDQVRHDLLARDDLATDLEAAGFHLAPAPADDADEPGLGAPDR